MPPENTQLDRGDEIKSPLDNAGKPADDNSAKQPDGGDSPAGDKLAPDEGEETAEEKAEREAAEEEARKRAAIRIPKSRFDEAQSKARAREQALLEEIDRLKGGKQAANVQNAVATARKKLDELETRYEDLLLDGKKDEARAVRREANALRDELAEHNTSVKSDAARAAAIEELKYDAQLANLESQYNVMNPDHEEFDEDVTNEIAALVTALVKDGKTRDVALAKAVKYVLGAPPAQKTSDAAKLLAEERARKARTAAAEADKKQPPNTSKVGLDSDKGGGGGEAGIDIMRMSQEKFAKLDEDTKAKLRGDEV